MVFTYQLLVKMVPKLVGMLWLGMSGKLEAMGLWGTNCRSWGNAFDISF